MFDGLLKWRETPAAAPARPAFGSPGITLIGSRPREISAAPPQAKKKTPKKTPAAVLRGAPKAAPKAAPLDDGGDLIRSAGPALDRYAVAHSLPDAAVALAELREFCRANRRDVADVLAEHEDELETRARVARTQNERPRADVAAAEEERAQARLIDKARALLAGTT